PKSRVFNSLSRPLQGTVTRAQFVKKARLALAIAAAERRVLSRARASNGCARRNFGRRFDCKTRKRSAVERGGVLINSLAQSNRVRLQMSYKVLLRVPGCGASRPLESGQSLHRSLARRRSRELPTHNGKTLLDEVT